MKAYLIAQEQATWSPPHGSKQQSEEDNDISECILVTIREENWQCEKCQYKLSLVQNWNSTCNHLKFWVHFYKIEQFPITMGSKFSCNRNTELSSTVWTDLKQDFPNSSYPMQRSVDLTLVKSNPLHITYCSPL
jgi:hypothetical protein